MYIPAHFRADDAAVRELLINHGAADLITSTASGLLATMLPFIYEEPGSSPEAGEHGRLLGHVARNNDQWREPAEGDALVIVRGPDAYISPSWYETTREHGRSCDREYVRPTFGRSSCTTSAWSALVRRLRRHGHRSPIPEPGRRAGAYSEPVEVHRRLELTLSRRGQVQLRQNRSAATSMRDLRPTAAGTSGGGTQFFPPAVSPLTIGLPLALALHPPQRDRIRYP